MWWKEWGSGGERQLGCGTGKRNQKFDREYVFLFLFFCFYRVVLKRSIKAIKAIKTFQRSRSDKGKVCF